MISPRRLAAVVTARRDGVRKLGDHPMIPRGMATLPQLPSLQTPLPVLSPDQPEAKPKGSKPTKLRKE
jgi:hypothetical protein